MLKHALSSRFRGANGFYTSYGFAFLFDTLSGYLTTLHKLILGANIASKTFEMALKSKIHFQKSKKKFRIFYPFPNLKMLENVLSSRFGGANGFSSSHGLDFFFHTLSRYSTTLQNFIWGTKAA
jgi:hypothetical protein